MAKMAAANIAKLSEKFCFKYRKNLASESFI